MRATPGNEAEEEGLSLFPLLAVASWKEQLASLVLRYSEDQYQGLGALGASNTLTCLGDEALGWEEMEGCGGGTWARPLALFPISQAHAGMLRHFDHDGAKLMGPWVEESIPGWERDEKELCPPTRASLQPPAFLWVFYCVLGALGPWLTISWAGNSPCSCIWDMAALVG